MCRNIFGIVLAGGSGTRLWPISRHALPKQCVNFKGDKTLLETTLARIAPVAVQENICVVTSQEYKTVIERLVGNSSITIIAEPEARNTAAAMLLSVLEIYAKNPEAVLFFVPADHYISESELFVSGLQEALSLAGRERKIVLLGVKPTCASTEYGYIEADCEKNSHEIKNFYEKPDKIRAQEFIAQGNFLWNTGIFVGRTSVFLEEFRVLAPELLEKVREYKQGLRAYAEISAHSFDKLILERTKNRAVMPAYFRWSDVGSLENFIAAQDFNLQKVIEINAHNNLVSQAKKIVVLSGVDNLCVIETEDMLFICPREQAGNIKSVTEYLKNNGFEKYL